MSTDPRIEAAAAALLTFEITTLPLDEVPGPTFRHMMRQATAALAAADKAATITERAQFEALPNNTVIEDFSGDVGIISNGYIWYPETAAISLQRASKRYLPARVIHRGTK